VAVIGSKIKIMKTTFFAFVCSIGFISYAIAGPVGAGGGTRMVPLDPATGSAPPDKGFKVPETFGTGSSARDNTTPVNASTSGSVDAPVNSSSNASSTIGNAGAHGAPLRNPNA